MRSPFVDDAVRGVHRAVARVAGRIDGLVLDRMERRMRATVPRRQGPRDGLQDARPRLLELASFYGDGTLGTPSRFFPAPPRVQVTERNAPDGPEGARVTDLAFESPYVPFRPDHRREHDSYPENLTARARLYTLRPAAGAPPRPVMVLIHGWGGGHYWLEERAFAVPYWLRRGYDVALAVLPFHGPRSPTGKSGALFPSAHVVRTNEAFGQAVMELRALRAHLARRGAAVGAMGMSLGGYTTALWASVDPDLAFAVPMIPAVDMADLMWRHGETSPALRRASAAGVDADLLREVFAVHAPTTRPPLTPAAGLMIVAGRGDRITPPDQAERLWRHWGECPIHWFPGGHLAQVGRGDAFRAVRRRLDALGLTPPSAARSPR
ncbi:MAG: alpha/beta hydrolase family protein [Myxococcales bacterium]|nr:alpha/beta hydrolase family protein [Myxococcales bacterium]